MILTNWLYSTSLAGPCRPVTIYEIFSTAVLSRSVTGRPKDHDIREPARCLHEKHRNTSRSCTEHPHWFLRLTSPPGPTILRNGEQLPPQNRGNVKVPVRCYWKERQRVRQAAHPKRWRTHPGCLHQVCMCNHRRLVIYVTERHLLASARPPCRWEMSVLVLEYCLNSRNDRFKIPKWRIVVYHKLVHL